MKRVYVYAYTEMNLGDDLFIKVICERYPNVKFYIMAKLKNSYPFENIKNLVVIPKIPWIDGLLTKFKVKKSINGLIQRRISSFCDAIVCIGGSLFIQNQDWYIKTHQFKKRIVYNKPFFVLGSNFGPYTDDGFLQSFKSIFSSLDDICFRDEYSHRLFSDLINVRKEADVVFSYLVKSKVKEIDKVTISVINLNSRPELAKYQKEYIEKIAEIAKKFSDNNYAVTLMGFCTAEGDSEIINEILENKVLNNRKHIEKYIYTGNINEALYILQESKIVVGSRFHAMILGWLFYKKVYPIIYSEKSLNVMSDIGFKGPYINIKDIEQLDFESDYKKLLEMPKLMINKEINSANQQFKKLDELLLNS